MPIRMNAVRNPVGIGTPNIQALPYDSADAIVVGSVLISTAGIANLAGADPALILGIALQAADTNPGYQAANSPVPITGRSATIDIAIADANTIYMATLTNGSSTRIAPADANIRLQYGITAYSGIWTVDTAKTAADARVQIVGYSTEIYGAPGVVFFRFLADHIYGAT